MAKEYTHQDEFKKAKTIMAYTEKEIIEGKQANGDDLHWGLPLMLKDCKEKIPLNKKVAIELDLFLGYNNIDYISEEDCTELANKIIKLIKKFK